MSTIILLRYFDQTNLTHTPEGFAIARNHYSLVFSHWSNIIKLLITMISYNFCFQLTFFLTKIWNYKKCCCLFSSDVNYLSTSAPPAAAEWSSLLRPLRGREPEGMWNLLSIVREMFKRNDRNAIPLLEIITEEVMACEQVSNENPVCLYWHSYGWITKLV